MDNLPIYLLKASTGTIIFYICYLLFFSSDTFYLRNRIYLLIGLILSFIIPLIKISIFSKGVAAIEPVKRLNDIILSGAVAETTITGKITANVWNNFIIWSYFAIAGLLFLRVIFSVTKAYSIIRKGTLHDTSFPKVILSDIEYPPFSFFPFIVIPRTRFKTDDYPGILRHENAHVRQGHTFDLILSEVLTAILWFNPVMWLIKRSIVLNHEYLADNFSLKNSRSIKEYQYKLLNIPKGMRLVPLAHNYSSSVKKRIVMINKRPTRNYAALKNIMILPVVATLIVTCSLNNKELIPGYNSSSSGDEKFISINDYRNSEVPETDLSKYKDRDFEIYRTKSIRDDVGNTYWHTSFQLRNSKLEKQIDFATVAIEDYDKASYKWENDSTLMFTMINSSTKSTASFRLRYDKNKFCTQLSTIEIHSENTK
jgi:hypothetical protein